MADIYGPFDGASWSQDQWYRSAPAWAQSGVLGSAPSSLTAGDLPFSANGLTITIGLGRAWIRGGGYERTSTPWTDTVTANATGNPRIDRVVLRRDLAAKTITVARIAGTPASSPAAPALTQIETGIWEEKLYSFVVPASSGTTLTGVVDERNWLSIDTVEAKMWRTSSFSAPLTPNVMTVINFDAARTTGGFVFDSTADTLMVPANGLYDLRARGYASGGSGYSFTYRVTRQRAGVADREVIVSPYGRKVDANDESLYMGDRVPLQAGDKVYLRASFSAGGTYWGTDEGSGVYLAAEYKGPLNGATPY